MILLFSMGRVKNAPNISSTPKWLFIQEVGLVDNKSRYKSDKNLIRNVSILELKNELFMEASSSSENGVGYGRT